MPTYREEIDYMMDCADLDRDGKLDYMEFTHRFHSPAEQIGRDEEHGSTTTNFLLVLDKMHYTFIHLTSNTLFLHCPTPALPLPLPCHSPAPSLPLPYPSPATPPRLLPVCADHHAVRPPPWRKAAGVLQGLTELHIQVL